MNKLVLNSLLGVAMLAVARVVCAASPDALLVQSLIDISHSQMNSALSSIDSVLKTNPNFRLAQ
ncbi:MAG: hypothetical protein ACYCZR_11785, partial [Burkholderiales bacterium]